MTLNYTRRVFPATYPQVTSHQSQCNTLGGPRNKWAAWTYNIPMVRVRVRVSVGVGVRVRGVVLAGTGPIRVRNVDPEVF